MSGFRWAWFSFVIALVIPGFAHAAPMDQSSRSD